MYMIFRFIFDYYRYFAYDEENKRDVLWIDINIKEVEESHIHSFMKTVLPCIRDNPVVFVQFYDYWVDMENCILSIITENPGYESLANSLGEKDISSQRGLDDSNESINSDDSNNSKNNREFTQDIFLRFSSLLRALELCQKFDPSILSTCFSSHSLYVNKESNSIQCCLFPLFFNSSLLQSPSILCYLPLECIQSRSISSPSSIVYSLGVCLYEMVTNTRLYECDSVTKLLELKQDEVLFSFLN